MLCLSHTASNNEWATVWATVPEPSSSHQCWPCALGGRYFSHWWPPWSEAAGWFGPSSLTLWRSWGPYPKWDPALFWQPHSCSHTHCVWEHTMCVLPHSNLFQPCVPWDALLSVTTWGPHLFAESLVGQPHCCLLGVWASAAVISHSWLRTGVSDALLWVTLCVRISIILDGFILTHPMMECLSQSPILPGSSKTTMLSESVFPLAGPEGGLMSSNTGWSGLWLAANAVLLL